MLEIKNLDELVRQLEKWEGDVYEHARQVFVGLTVKYFKALVTTSAQYSGDFAGNWNYSIGRPDYTFKDNLFPGRDRANVSDARIDSINPRRGEGDGEAVSYAFKRARSQILNVALVDTVYFTNAAHHDEPYADLVYEDKIKFRPANRGNMQARVADIMRHYEVVDARKAVYLRREKL